MIERLQKLRPFIKTHSAHSADVESLNLTEGQWSTIEELIALLTPFDDATSMLTADKHPTISGAYLAIRYVLKHLSNISQSVKMSKQIHTDLRQQIMDRWPVPSESSTKVPVWLVATYLDPRFKRLHFLSVGLGAKVQFVVRLKFQQVKDRLPTQQPEGKC